METRSRKRAEASSSNSPATRSSKRPRTSSDPQITSRTRHSSAMDSDHASGRRDRRSSGKERDHPEGSSREAERILGISFDSTGADDDNDSESGVDVGILHQNFTNASSALQGLLRKLGAGLDDLLPSSAVSGSSSSHQSSRLKKILSGLRADGEEGRQVEVLTQLCELLSIGTEDSLGSFSVDSFVPVLVGLLNHESNPDVMILAARALTHLCEVLPSSCAAVVHYGAIPCFCARLLTIEYMDLAEQSLQALKKISQEHPTACLRAGALMAVLSYLDFFSTGVQRVALSTAANMCKKLPSDAADFVMEAVPLLTNLLHYHDAKVLEHASVCLTRIAEAFASSPDKLDELCNHGLVAQTVGIISLSNTGGQASLSTSTYTGLIRLLSTCASGSPLAAKTLLLLGISGILKDILSGSGLVASVSVFPALSRPPEQVYEIVNLADELLPLLPQGTVSLPTYSNILVKGSAGKRIAGSSLEKQEEANGTNNEPSAHEKLLQDQPELLQQFGLDLLPILTQIYGSSVNGPIRHRCLSVIGKLMHFSSAGMIQTLLSATNISSFLAGVLAWKDPQVLIPALQIAEILMEKLPEFFSKTFVREGVVHAVDALIRSVSSNTTPQSSFSEATDSGLDTSSRSWRYRRRSGGLNTDGGLPDEAKVSTAGTTGSPPLSEAPAANNSIRAAVSEFAKLFKDKHFPAVPGATEIGITEDLLLLKNLSSKLNAGADDVKTTTKGKSKTIVTGIFDTSISMEGELDDVIFEMLTELNKGNGVSTFEFIGSGVVVALLNYFSCGTFGKDRASETNLPNLRHQALRRYKSFVELALPIDVMEGNEAPMSILVKKLQNALSSLERFPVVLSHPSRSSSGGSARLSSGLNTLSQPFKLRLSRAHGEKSLRDYSSNIVLIDPLASLAAVEEFLWPRIQRSDPVQKTSASAGTPAASVPVIVQAPSLGTSTPSARRPTTRSRSSVIIGDTAGKESSEGNANSSKGKGKAVLKSAPDDEKGPQTRNAARRRAASEKDTEMKPAHCDFDSEDDDLDMSPIEIDESLMIEEEDISDDDEDDHDEVLRDDSLPVCALDKVHDVKLGDPVNDSANTPPASDGHTQLSASTNKTPPIRGSELTELRSINTFSSRGAMSFAAAAMAGLASVSGKGIRVSRDCRGLPHESSVHEQYNKLTFTVGGNQLSKQMTIYQAIQRQLVLDDEVDDRLNGSELMPADGSRFWNDIFTITYQKADNQADGSAQGGLSSSVKSLKSGSASNSSSDSRWKQLSLLDSILQGELPCDIDKSSPTYTILALLRVLEGLNQLAPRLRVQKVTDDYAAGKVATLDELDVSGAKVPPEEFINNKLTPKLARQIQDALALCSGGLPSWCYQLTKGCPFLFPFGIRRQYFYSTAFGLSRALHRLQQQQNAENTSAANEREVRVGRLQRQKVRVSRNRILESAIKVMEMYSSQKAVLEVEYFGEVGTGLGPTLEFYTLLSHDLQKVGLELWRSNSSLNTSAMEIDEEDVNNADIHGENNMASMFAQTRDFIHAPLGLFPRPWPPNADASEGSHFSKVIEYFRLVGRVMAKALQDGRLLDLPLSIAFYKLVLGQELDLFDILSFDIKFGKILQELQIVVNRKRFLETSERDEQRVTADLCFRGAPIEDLCLDFSLPGYPDYILKEGEESMVNIDNLEMYISLVVDATVKTGIMRQIEAFTAGFNQVFDISSLQIFCPHELDHLICGRRELWEPETMADHIKFDHGYTAKSPAITNLLEIMAEFTPEQQHAFCQFVTGAPRLPPGGLAALNPKLTIVRKHSSTTTNTSANGATASESADDDLPSVMTCAHYLKLPPYSTKAIMYNKLLYAINEGQGSFDLS